MIQFQLIRILLLPVSLLYGLVIWIRNLLYNQKVLKETRFDFPIISIGNLSVGGTGKTPHIEYLIRLLSPYIHVGTLSRGYKRKTIGYQKVETTGNALQYGDEPLQFKRKYPHVAVAVAENRVFGLPRLLMDAPQTQVVLLDDAFQHRSIKPALNILLTEYKRPYFSDFVLPSGRLREWPASSTRADMIIVTKCPPGMTTDQRDQFLIKLKPEPDQKVYFSTYDYGQPYYFVNENIKRDIGKKDTVVLMTAIADTDFLLEYIRGKTDEVYEEAHEDHHVFSNYDIAQIQKKFAEIDNPLKFILTTEKDAMRLEMHKKFIMEKNLPIFVLPVQVKFLFNESQPFDNDIKRFLLDYKI